MTWQKTLSHEEKMIAWAKTLPGSITGPRVLPRRNILFPVWLHDRTIRGSAADSVLVLRERWTQSRKE